MIYIAGFALVFCGFCLGVIVAALCCASGRASQMEERIEDEDEKKHIDIIHKHMKRIDEAHDRAQHRGGTHNA